MTAVGSLLVSELRHREALSIVGVDIAHESAFVDVLWWNTENDSACTLAIEVLLVDELGFAFCIE
ncbi:MAG: hypothetical protein IIT53_04095 [Fibrobacter sp.]|nr:hypothetical protein [Fibrobacter sp.]